MEKMVHRCSNDRTQLISQLPDELISHIISLLDPKYLASVVLVCKGWYSIIARYFHRPNFNQSSFRSFDSFMDFVEESLAQYLKHQPTIPKLKLQVTGQPGFDNTRFNNLLAFTATNNFHRLRLILSEGPPLFLTTLAYKSLSRLQLLQLKGEFHIGYQLIDQIDDLFNLETLELTSVYITGATLSKFLTKCPSLVILCLEDCKELVEIKVPPLTKLEVFHVFNVKERMTMVKVEAPELLSFAFSDFGCLDLPVVVDLQPCRNLDELSLHCYRFPNICLDFPHLKSLYLSCKLTLSGHPTISTPNLCRFEGSSSDMKILSLPIDAPGLLDTKITLYGPEKGMEDWFLKLRSSLTRLRKDATLCLKLKVCYLTGDEFGVVSDPAARIKHLKIVATGNSCSWPRCKGLIDGLFFCCRPKTLSLKWSDEDILLLNHSFAKSLRSGLEDRSCNNRAKTNWRGFLKCYEVKQVVGSKGHKKMVFSFEWYD